MTISESLYFTYDGISSSDFGILHVNLNDGLFSESFLPSRSIVEETGLKRKEPYFFGFEYSPREIPLSFAFEEKYNDELMFRVMDWLYKPYYKPLVFSEYPDRIFYAVVDSDSELVHDGLKRGYANINFRCNSPYSFSPQYTKDFLIENNLSGYDLTIENNGHLKVRPNITIRKIGTGDISIINNSDGGKETKIINLSDQEIVTIDGDNEIIETSVPNVYRFNDFNYNFLELTKGSNYIRVLGDAYIEFVYQSKRY